MADYQPKISRKCGVGPAFLYTSFPATFQVMRKHQDTVSVVWEKILLRPPSLCGRLTDRKSEEQQADEVVSSTIDCQLTSKLHYTDRPELQHDDLHSTNALITTYESLTGTNLSCALALLALSCFLSTECLPGHGPEFHSVNLMETF